MFVCFLAYSGAALPFLDIWSSISGKIKGFQTPHFFVYSRIIAAQSPHNPAFLAKIIIPLFGAGKLKVVMKLWSFLRVPVVLAVPLPIYTGDIFEYRIWEFLLSDILHSNSSSWLLGFHFSVASEVPALQLFEIFGII